MSCFKSNWLSLEHRFPRELLCVDTCLGPLSHRVAFLEGASAKAATK